MTPSSSARGRPTGSERSARSSAPAVKYPGTDSHTSKYDETEDRGLGSGIPRALEAWPDIDFRDDHEGGLFVATVRRKAPPADLRGTPTAQVTAQVAEHVLALVQQLDGELTRSELQEAVRLTHRDSWPTPRAPATANCFQNGNGLSVESRDARGPRGKGCVRARGWPVKQNPPRPPKTAPAVKRSRLLSPRWPAESARPASRTPSARAPTRPQHSLLERCPSAPRPRHAPKPPHSSAKKATTPEIALRGRCLPKPLAKFAGGFLWLKNCLPYRLRVSRGTY
jgi:hypothetical protein